MLFVFILELKFNYSADGRKVLRSSIREFLCSEAMYYLGIPTVRSGSCVTSDTVVDRDPFYDGHVIKERCSIITRMAPNFFRFGSFEIFKEAEPLKGIKAGPSAGNEILKKQLLDHIIKTGTIINPINEKKIRVKRPI